MRKLMRMLAVASVCLAFAASPAAALSDERDEGPMPIAFIGVLFGAPMWAISTPFTALIAPTRVMDSFEELVMRPVNAMIGAKAPHEPCLLRANAVPRCVDDDYRPY